MKFADLPSDIKKEYPNSRGVRKVIRSCVNRMIRYHVHLITGVRHTWMMNYAHQKKWFCAYVSKSYLKEKTNG